MRASSAAKPRAFSLPYRSGGRGAGGRERAASGGPPYHSERALRVWVRTEESLQAILASGHESLATGVFPSQAIPRRMRSNPVPLLLSNHHRIKKQAQKVPYLRVRKRPCVHQVLEQHRMRKRPQSRSRRRTGNRQRSPQRFHHPPQNSSAARPQPSLPRPQTRMSLRMPHRKKFKLQRKQSEPPVLCNLRVMLAKRPQALLRVVVPFQQLVHFANPLCHPLLQQSEKNTFLALEVRVKSPPRISRPRRNILQPRRLIPVPRKSLLCRKQQLLPRSRRTRLLPRRGDTCSLSTASRGGHRRAAHGLVSFTLFTALQDTYMHVYNKSPTRTSIGDLWPLPP
jgi:hypothetical protein